MPNARTLSSTKTLPFFFPRGFSTPTGVIMFSFGKPSSFSVYTLRFFFCGPFVDFVFCCFGGGAFTFFDTRFFVLAPRAPGLLEILLPLLVLLEPVFFGGPLVGAMLRVVDEWFTDWCHAIAAPRSFSKRSSYLPAVSASPPNRASTLPLKANDPCGGCFPRLRNAHT